MPDDPKYVEIRGGVQDGVVYLRASDVVKSLRLTATTYRDLAVDDEELGSVFKELASLFEGEADEFDLLSMRLEVADLEDSDEELSLAELDEESDG